MVLRIQGLTPNFVYHPGTAPVQPMVGAPCNLLAPHLFSAHPISLLGQGAPSLCIARTQSPYPGGCGDSCGGVRNDANTQRHRPCFNASLSFLPAGQQVVVGYIDKEFVVPDLVKPTGIVKACRKEQACNVGPGVGREGEMTVDVA